MSPAAHERTISAVVLAAGLSQRMGEPKMVLPWNEGTIIAHVVQTLQAGDVKRITIVTGFRRELVQAALAGKAVDFAYNERYANGEMLISLQTGLCTLSEEIDAALIVLGDQPQMQPETVRQVLERYAQSGGKLVVPSYQMRRGHPWLVEHELWPEILALRQPQTLRDFMQSHEADIRYLNVNTPTIFQDVDTPEDYRRFNERE